ncbi:patatin-like phospholipase family protein, partial [bacterium]|nr:patatin-like phospholipase family protein [bacterium]
MSAKPQALPKKIGLAMGGGAARGWAHIGVIRALTEAGIRVDCVAGTSIGALVGAFYSAGRIDTLHDLVLKLEWNKIVSFMDMVFPKSGIIDGKKIADFTRGHVDKKNIEELPIPFCTVSTDLSTGREIIIQHGDVIEAVRASISVPGIFTPVRKDKTFLVDGGLVNPVPVSAVRNMGADFIIAVDLNHDVVKNRGGGRFRSNPSDHTSGPVSGSGQISIRKGPRQRMLDALDRRAGRLDAGVFKQIRRWVAKDPAPNIFEVLTSSINIMEAQITESRLQTDSPDILIRPNLGHIRFLEF